MWFGSWIAVSGPSEDPGQAGSWLRWSAPTMCPDHDAVENATQRRLGRTVDLGEITVVATVDDRNSDGLQLTLDTTREGVTDTHSMTAHDCGALADAAALVIALTLDPVTTTRVAEAASAQSAPTQPPPTPPRVLAAGPPSPATTPRPPAPRRSGRPSPAPPGSAAGAPTSNPTPSTTGSPAPDPAILLAASGGLEFGALPGLSGGPRVTLTVGWARLRLEASGWYAAPRTAVADAGSVRVQMGAATVLSCARLGTAAVEVPICGGLEVGGTHARGSNAPDSRVARGLWLAPTMSSGGHGWVTPRLALLGRVEVAIPVRATAYDVREPAQPLELFRPRALSGRFWLGIEGKLRGL